MKLGIITTPDAAGIRWARDMGVDAAEFCLNVGVDLDAVIARKDEILNALQETGLVMGSIGRWGPDRICADGLCRDELANERKLLALCRDLHCPVYVTGCNMVEGLSFYQNCTLAIEYLSELMQTAEEYGVKVCTYNCHWNSFLDCDPAWTVVHGHLPALGIKYDPSHAFAGGRDYLAETQAWGHRFYHVHLKGSLYAAGQHIDDPPAGMDCTNWGAFMAMLYQKGYNGVLSVEPHSATWQGRLGEAGIRYTVDYFKRFLLA